MPYTAVLSASELADHLADPEWAVVDGRFSLDDVKRGRRDYRRAYIPGAVCAPYAYNVVPDGCFLP